MSMNDHHHVRYCIKFSARFLGKQVGLVTTRTSFDLHLVSCYGVNGSLYKLSSLQKVPNNYVKTNTVTNPFTY